MDFQECCAACLKTHLYRVYQIREIPSNPAEVALRVQQTPVITDDETEQDGVAHNAPNGVDGVPGNCHALDQHGINCHADEDEKALKAQSR